MRLRFSILAFSLAIGSLFGCKTITPDSGLSTITSKTIGDTKACNESVEESLKRTRKEQLERAEANLKMVHDASNSPEVRGAALAIATSIIAQDQKWVDDLAKQYDSDGLEKVIRERAPVEVQNLAKAYSEVFAKDAVVREDVLNRWRNDIDELRVRNAAKPYVANPSDALNIARAELRNAEMAMIMTKMINDPGANAVASSMMLEALAEMARVGGAGEVNDYVGTDRKTVAAALSNLDPAVNISKANLYMSMLSSGNEVPSDVSGAFSEAFREPYERAWVMFTLTALKAQQNAEYAASPSAIAANEQLRKALEYKAPGPNQKSVAEILGLRAEHMDFRNPATAEASMRKSAEIKGSNRTLEDKYELMGIPTQGAREGKLEPKALRAKVR